MAAKGARAQAPNVAAMATRANVDAEMPWPGKARASASPMNAPDDELSAKVVAFLERQQAGERAAPPAALDAMGYDQAGVWGDPVIRSYCERFGVEPERTRLFGAAPAS